MFSFRTDLEEFVRCIPISHWVVPFYNVHLVIYILDQRFYSFKHQPHHWIKQELRPLVHWLREVNVSDMSMCMDHNIMATTTVE